MSPNGRWPKLYYTDKSGLKSTLNPIRYHNPHTTSETLKYILYPLSGRGGDVPDRLGGSAAQVGFVGAVGVDEAA